MDNGGFNEELHHCHLPVAVDVGSTEGKAVADNGGFNEELHHCHLPVAVDVGSTEGKAVMDEGGVNEWTMVGSMRNYTIATYLLLWTWEAQKAKL